MSRSLSPVRCLLDWEHVLPSPNLTFLPALRHPSADAARFRTENGESGTHGCEFYLQPSGAHSTDHHQPATLSDCIQHCMVGRYTAVVRHKDRQKQVLIISNIARNLSHVRDQSIDRSHTSRGRALVAGVHAHFSYLSLNIQALFVDPSSPPWPAERTLLTTVRQCPLTE